MLLVVHPQQKNSIDGTVVHIGSMFHVTRQSRKTKTKKRSLLFSYYDDTHIIIDRSIAPKKTHTKNSTKKKRKDRNKTKKMHTHTHACAVQ